MSRSMQPQGMPVMSMPEPIRTTEPLGYDVDGYRTGGFVAPPPSAQQQFAPKPNGAFKPPNFPPNQPSGVQSPPASKPQAPPSSFTPLQPPQERPQAAALHSGNSFYLRKAQHETHGKPKPKHDETPGCQCVIC